jgi:hypothetical protein
VNFFISIIKFNIVELSLYYGNARTTAISHHPISKKLPKWHFLTPACNFALCSYASPEGMDG